MLSLILPGAIAPATSPPTGFVETFAKRDRHTHQEKRRYPFRIMVEVYRWTPRAFILVVRRSLPPDNVCICPNETKPEDGKPEESVAVGPIFHRQHNATAEVGACTSALQIL